ncbi:MAG: OmpA family protein [Nitrospiraceae bacterium]|nr:OmpA family protein [Nitrospiraceae bacterium]
MQNPASSVSSGNISPTIVGPSKDSKEVYLIGGLVMAVAIVIGAFWYYSGQDQSYTVKASTEPLANNHIAHVLKTSTIPPVKPIVHNQTAPTTSFKLDSIHTDLYFEVGRKGLTDEAKAILATQANLAKQDPDLGILVQGYTDRQGSTDYNMKLGMKRAETVKTELVNAGVAEHQIKVVSLGKDGVLCLDNSDVCRNMNRRVHLEIRKIGKDHMILSTVATEPQTTEPIQSKNDQNSHTESHGALMDNLLPSLADPSTADPASGS